MRSGRPRRSARSTSWTWRSGSSWGLIAGVVLASLRDQARDRIQAPPRRQVPRCADPGSIPARTASSVGTAHLASVDEPHGQARRGVPDAEGPTCSRSAGNRRRRRSSSRAPVRARARRARPPTWRSRLAQAGRSVVLISRRPTQPARPRRVRDRQRAGPRAGPGRNAPARRGDRRNGSRRNCASCPAGRSDAVDEPVELLQSDRGWARCSRSAVDRISWSSMVRPSSRLRTAWSSPTSSTVSSS